MSWRKWADELRQTPLQAVADLLRGVADVGPFERVAAHEFLLAVLPRTSRNVSQSLLGEPRFDAEAEIDTDLPAYLDSGLAAWLLAQRQAPPPPARKLGAYAAQICEALQWPLYFALPKTLAALRAERALWLQWLSSLTLSAYRDPEYEYWQVLAAHQSDDRLQFFWQSFVVEAGRTRSLRYLNLGLLALAKLPLSVEDSLRNLRLQVQTLINRYQRRKSLGTAAHEELAQALRAVMARNPSLNVANYRAFLTELLTPLGEDKAASVLGLLGLLQNRQLHASPVSRNAYKLKPPALADETDQTVRTVRRSQNLTQAWNVINPLLSAHEDYLHKSGDAYHFVRALDKCARALCEKYSLRESEVQSRLFQWIHLALRMDADEPRRWMLWELALRQAEQPQRAQWVLWEMTRRFPDQLPCRVELARLLAASDNADEQNQAQRLLRQVLQLDADNLYAHSTLAQLAIRYGDWAQALEHAQKGLSIESSHGASALLLATAYARRNEPGDLQTAIEQLQRFVNRYSGNVNAEGYLRVLLQRRQSAQQGKLPDFDDEEETVINPDSARPETDPAWRAFAESTQSWLTISAAGEDMAGNDETAWTERVLPLPQALRQAVAQRQWQADVLDRYDAAAQREFPLETRLWHYLQALRSDSVSECERSKQALQDWLDAETRSSTETGKAWLSYLQKHRAALDTSSDSALETGAEWLKDLLDRYRPLPAPLLV